MRKLLYTVVGAAALATASIASAAVTVTSSTGLNDPNPTAAGSTVVNGNITTINFGQNPVSTPTFSGSFTLTNTLSDLYSIVISTSTPGVTFTSASLSGGSCTVATCTLMPFPDNTSLKLASTLLTPGTYTFNFAGNAGADASGALTGNVTIMAAPVPEAATWGMMILGFGAMGFAIRRRRRPVLAQLA
jgi:hypothetical protein